MPIICTETDELLFEHVSVKLQGYNLILIFNLRGTIFNTRVLFQEETQFNAAIFYIHKLICISINIQIRDRCSSK